MAAAALAGTWEGWAKLVNDWPGFACRYEGRAETTSVRLALTNDRGLVRGSVAIDLAAEPGSGCPPLRKRYVIPDVSTSAGSVAFTDDGGHEWTLSLRRQGGVLQGLLNWRAGGHGEPLAEGFTHAGVRPLERLGGEVRLHRTSAPPEAAVAAKGGAAPASPAGAHLRNLGIVLGANVVGLAALVGVNKLGKGQSSEGGVTCSPRVCTVGAPNAPCLCNNDIINGAPCGETKTGVAEGDTGSPCDGVGRPCQAGLSCNSGFCQDENGRCPW